MGGDLVLEVLDQFENGTASHLPQGDTDCKYARMIKKEMGNIDWSEPAEVIERKVRGFDPWPGAYTFLNGKLVKIWKAGVSERDADLKPGTIIAGKEEMFVATGDKLLKVEELQLTGKKRNPAAEFLRGIRLEEGAAFDRE